MRIDLSSKIALVTGASGELGRVMARTLAKCGADVAVHYLKSADKAAAVCDEIKALGRRAIAVQADVTDEKSVFRMRDEVTAKLGKPLIIVNNAVIQYTCERKNSERARTPAVNRNRPAVSAAKIVGLGDEAERHRGSAPLSDSMKVSSHGRATSNAKSNIPARR